MILTLKALSSGRLGARLDRAKITRERPSALAGEYSTELVEWQQAVPTIPQEVLNLARKIDIESSLDNSGANTATLDIMAQILRAESAEDVFAASNAGAVSAKDFIGIPFKFHSKDLAWKRSAAVFRENGNFPYYMLVRCTNLQTGEEFVMTCGAPSVIAVLWRLGELGELERGDETEDGSSFILDSKPVSSGFSVILIRPFKLAAPSGKKA